MAVPDHGVGGARAGWIGRFGALSASGRGDYLPCCLAIIPLLSGLFFLLTAPLKQRVEARRELVAVRERLRPKLRITKVNKSFDSDWQLQDAMIDIESLRVTITNGSTARIRDCSVSLLGLLPRIHRVPRTIGNVTRYTPNAFDGYPDIPFPIELAWADTIPGQMPTKKDIPPLGSAQMSVLSHTSGGSDPGLTIAFSSKEQRARYRMPTTEVVLALRVDSDSSLPCYYIMRYFPGKIDWSGDTSFEILCEGTDLPDLEQFRIKEETETQDSLNH